MATVALMDAPPQIATVRRAECWGKPHAACKHTTPLLPEHACCEFALEVWSCVLSTLNLHARQALLPFAPLTNTQTPTTHAHCSAKLTNVDIINCASSGDGAAMMATDTPITYTTGTVANNL